MGPRSNAQSVGRPYLANPRPPADCWTAVGVKIFDTAPNQCHRALPTPGTMRQLLDFAQCHAAIPMDRNLWKCMQTGLDDVLASGAGSAMVAVMGRTGGGARRGGRCRPCLR